MRRPCDCNLIFTTSQGFANVIAIDPDMIAVFIFYIRVGYCPSSSGPVIQFLISKYRPTRRPEKIICLCKPADRPANNWEVPSSTAIVLTVPMRPLYRGSYPGTAFWSCSLTLAVSSGSVMDSAMQAAVEAISMLRKK